MEKQQKLVCVTEEGVFPEVYINYTDFSAFVVKENGERIRVEKPKIKELQEWTKRDREWR
ncbi:MAG: hypothetical protein MJZ30_09300 [Paludibacteraceae bacterium]|nr:hypothetical protein [Paludibacteraceae bacterium]